MSRVSARAEWPSSKDQIRGFCVRCLDKLVGEPTFDIVAEFATIINDAEVIGMLLGDPESTRSPCDRTDGMLTRGPSRCG